MLDFSLGDRQKANEDAGFGVRYSSDSSGNNMTLQDRHRIIVKFPRRQLRILIQEASTDVANLFPSAKGRYFNLVHFHLLGDGQIVVGGFGVPFANHQDPYIEGLVNSYLPINEGITILDILQQKSFCFFIAEPSNELERILWLDQPLGTPRYPYGNNHHWNVDRYERQLQQNKSRNPFWPAYSFENDDEHLAAITQSAVQDIFWLQLAADEIAKKYQPGYFVPVGDAIGRNVRDKQIRYLVFLHEGIPTSFKNAWRRLTKEARLHVALYEWADDEDPIAKWDCEIVDHPESIAELRDHPINLARELVIAVRLPQETKKDENDNRYGLKAFRNRLLANIALDTARESWNCVTLQFGNQLLDCERLVDSVCLFDPNAAPSNPRACGLLEPEEMSPEARALKLAEIQDRMDLHRTLLRGNGFHTWMTRSEPFTDMVSSMNAITLHDKQILRPLPVVNFIQSANSGLVDALVEELLPADRERFYHYISSRTLGLGLITAAAGHGKTTVMAVAAAVMHTKLGNILCSAPSNVAVSNFADRIDRVIVSACKNCNKDKKPGDAFRQRHKFVVRAYKDSDEIDAVVCLLKHPEHGDRALANNRPIPSSKWKLHLSLAFWVLSVLRSRAVTQLRPDDCQGLHDLRHKIDNSKAMEKIRAVAVGDITWDEFVKSGTDPKEKVILILRDLFPLVDILCTTPAMTVKVSQYAKWKAEKAQGVAVDEAANMHRADLYCVWGNTLLPCFLGGDPNQLSPAVLTQNERDDEGNLLNRFASTGKISALECFQAMGMPVFRMRVQLRMAEGLFDTVSRTIYDEPARYHDICNVENEKFKSGRVLEEYIRKKYPSVSPPMEGKLSPLFIHCEGTKVTVDPATGSKRSDDQIKVALDFVLDLVRTTEVKASQLIILTPYSANVELIKNFTKHPQYADALKGLGESSTIDGYQGQERDIVVVVMGTRAGHPGAGFTSDKQRLNVLLTRQRCGLVVVGDINVTGEIHSKDPRGGAALYVRYGQARSFTRNGVLQEVYRTMYRNGRCAVVKVNEAMALERVS